MNTAKKPIFLMFLDSLYLQIGQNIPYFVTPNVTPFDTFRFCVYKNVTPNVTPSVTPIRK